MKYDFDEVLDKWVESLMREGPNARKDKSADQISVI